MGRNAELREKQKWSIEKSKLDNAGRLRRIYFIDPEDKEFKEIIRNARNKLETPMAPAMPCKIMKKNCGSGGSNKIKKTNLACFLEADESTILRMGNSMPHYHQDHIAGKGENSLQHYNLVHKFLWLPLCLARQARKVSMGILVSTRMRMEESLPNCHEIHIAGKGDNSLQHDNLVHKFIPMPKP